MMFLVIVGIIGLAGVGATFYAIARDGYAPARPRDAAFYRSTFDHAAFHAQAPDVESGTLDSTAPEPRENTE